MAAQEVPLRALHEMLGHRNLTTTSCCLETFGP